MLAWAQRNKAVAAAAAGLAVGATAYAAYWYTRSYRRKRGAERTLATFGNFSYPVTASCNHVDEYFGVRVPDPYNWLEDPDAPAVKEWVQEQNRCTEAYFQQFSDQRDQFYSKLVTSFTYDKYGVTWQKGSFFFFSKKEGLQNQYVYYVQTSLDAEPRVLLDPNAIREDGTAAVTGTWVSEDGLKMAYGVSLSGSDWFTIYVRDVLTAQDGPDVISWCKFGSVAWTKDGAGFFYCKYPRPKTAPGDDRVGTEVDAAAGQKVYYHQLGTHEDTDQFVFESADNPKWLFNCDITDDGKTLLLVIHDSCDPVNMLYLFDLSRFNGQNVTTIGPCVKLIDTFKHEFEYITNDGPSFLFKTNMDAPRYKIIKMEVPATEELVTKSSSQLEEIWKSFEEVVPQADGVLVGITCCAQQVLCLKYMQDVKEILEVCDLNGKKRAPLPLPSLGTLVGPTGIRTSNLLFYQLVSFQDPGSSYMVEVTVEDDGIHNRTTFQRSPQVPGLSTSEFETTQVFFTSKDGTRIPMFIVQRADAVHRPGPRTCLLYGYGGFNISITPYFSASRLLFVKHFDAVYCVANIRGGGEYGEDWHKQGSLQHKQNCFDDFIAAAEYLIAHNYTTREQLAIQGGSNGGLLVAACANQRPDLFAAAVPQVGVMDMLKFHKFTIGYAWCSDYGCSEKSEEEFRTLFAYSPIHNIGPKLSQYPAMLVLTGDHDDRVVPLHSFKYIATLQTVVGSNPNQKRPLLIKIETKAGNGAGKPTHLMLAEAADVSAFVAYNTGASWRED